MDTRGATMAMDTSGDAILALTATMDVEDTDGVSSNAPGMDSPEHIINAALPARPMEVDTNSATAARSKGKGKARVGTRTPVARPTRTLRSAAQTKLPSVLSIAPSRSHAEKAPAVDAGPGKLAVAPDSDATYNLPPRSRKIPPASVLPTEQTPAMKRPRVLRLRDITTPRTPTIAVEKQGEAASANPADPSLRLDEGHAASGSEQVKQKVPREPPAMPIWRFVRLPKSATDTPRTSHATSAATMPRIWADSRRALTRALPALAKGVHGVFAHTRGAPVVILEDSDELLEDGGARLADGELNLMMLRDFECAETHLEAPPQEKHDEHFQLPIDPFPSPVGAPRITTEAHSVDGLDGHSAPLMPAQRPGFANTQMTSHFSAAAKDLEPSNIFSDYPRGYDGEAYPSDDPLVPHRMPTNSHFSSHGVAPTMLQSDPQQWMVRSYADDYMAPAVPSWPERSNSYPAFPLRGGSDNSGWSVDSRFKDAYGYLGEMDCKPPLPWMSLDTRQANYIGNMNEFHSPGPDPYTSASFDTDTSLCTSTYSNDAYVSGNDYQAFICAPQEDVSMIASESDCSHSTIPWQGSGAVPGFAILAAPRSVETVVPPSLTPASRKDSPIQAGHSKPSSSSAVSAQPRYLPSPYTQLLPPGLRFKRTLRASNPLPEPPSAASLHRIPELKMEIEPPTLGRPASVQPRTEPAAPLSIQAPTPAAPPDARIPSSIPPEIQTLIDAYTQSDPIVVLAARGAASRALGVRLPTEIAYMYLGLFAVARVQEERVAHAGTAAPGTAVGRVRWRFGLRWTPGGEGFLAEAGCPVKKPWWGAPLSAPDGNDSDPDSTPRYRNRRRRNLNYASRHKYARSLYSMLPSHLIGPRVHSTTSSGWHCLQCGKLNEEVMMRHRRCSSSSCKGRRAQTASGHALSLEAVREVGKALPLPLPDNSYPDSLAPSVAIWDDGMRTYLYALRRTSPVVVKHIFTSNLTALQMEATVLFYALQVDVELRRADGDASTCFSYTAGHGDGRAEAPAVAWSRVPACVMQARNFLVHQGCTYGEDPDAAQVRSLEILAWDVAGSTRAAESFDASEGLVLVLCLGAEVLLNITPSLGFDEPDSMFPDSRQALRANKPPNATKESAARAKVREKKQGNSVITITLVHGDVLMLSGDVFKALLNSAYGDLYTSHQFSVITCLQYHYCPYFEEVRMRFLWGAAV